MLDLFRRRDNVMRYVLMVVLGLVAVSMVVTLIPGFGMGGPSRSDDLLAEVGGKAITIRDAAGRIDQTIRSMGVPRQAAYTMASSIVDNLIAQQSTEYYATQMGFRVTDQELVDAIKLILPQAFPGGQFAGKEAYAGLLGQRGMSVADFESRVRAQLLTSKVGDMVEQGMIITPADLELEYRRQNDQIKIDYVALRRADVERQVTVSPEEIRAEYETNKSAMKVPEKRDVLIYFVDEALTASKMTISDADLERAYRDQIDRFQTPERLKVRHILLKTTDKSEAEVKQLEGKAQDLLKKLRGGADFAALAKANSDDPGSAVQGGELGYITKGQTVPNFEEAAWNLKPKELSNVVKTEYGFHILQLMERQEARLRPFEEAKIELVAETQRQVVYDKMQRNADSLRTELMKSGDNLQNKAAEFGASALRVTGIAPGDTNFPAIGESPELSAQIAGLKQGEVTSIVQAPDNRLAMAYVTAVQPERQAALEDSTAQIRSQIAARKTAEMLRTRSNEIRTKAQGGASLKALATEYKAEFKTSAPFNRNGAAEGLGSGELLADAFNKPVGYVPNVIGTNGDLFIARVTETIPASLEKLAQDREAIVTRIRQQRDRERIELFQDGLVEKLTKEGKVKIYQDNMQRLLNSFRTT